ncbi:LysM domain protein [Winkia neuii]|nr:LysM domain-containing protein [Winkia neuii]KWZ73033.1 LysM domain protein [Winkia neuii]
MAIDSLRQFICASVPANQFSALIAFLVASAGTIFSLWYALGGLALLVAQFAPAKTSAAIRRSLGRYGPPLLRKAAGVGISASALLGMLPATTLLANACPPASSSAATIDLGPGNSPFDLAPGKTSSSSYYKVREGDSLWEISQYYHRSLQTLYEANKAVIGSDPNLIYPGQTLSIPKEDK